MSQLHLITDPSAFNIDSVKNESNYIIAYEPSRNSVAKKVIVYYKPCDNYKVTDILYHNTNTNMYEVHSMPATRELPNLDPNIYIPKAVCCIPGAYMPDGKSRFVSVEPVITAPANVLTSTQHSIPGIEYVVTGDLTIASRFTKVTNKTTSKYLLACEYGTDIGDHNINNISSYPTGGALVPGFTNVYWPATTGVTGTIFKVPAVYSSPTGIPVADVIFDEMNDNINLTGDFDGAKHTSMMAKDNIGNAINTKITEFNESAPVQNWFVPASGELAMLYAKFYSVQYVIHKIKEAFSYAEYLPTNLASSSVYRAGDSDTAPGVWCVDYGYFNVRSGNDLSLTFIPFFKF